MREHRFVGVPNMLSRAHFRSDGRPKRRYSQTSAARLAERIGADAYRCPRCRGWHVGNPSPETRR